MAGVWRPTEGGGCWLIVTRACTCGCCCWMKEAGSTPDWKVTLCARRGVRDDEGNEEEEEAAAEDEGVTVAGVVVEGGRAGRGVVVVVVPLPCWSVSEVGDTRECSCSWALSGAFSCKPMSEECEVCVSTAVVVASTKYFGRFSGVGSGQMCIMPAREPVTKMSRPAKQHVMLPSSLLRYLARHLKSTADHTRQRPRHRTTRERDHPS